MRNTTLPIPILDTSPPARKSSGQNLANLLNSLELILNLISNEEMSHDLIAILTAMHNQLISRLDINATATIALYKELALWFFNYIRGLRGPQGNFKSEDWSVTHNCPALFVELLPWYDMHSKPTLSQDKKDLFWKHVQIVYAFLNGHRVIVTPLSVNLSTITGPLTVKALPDYTSLWPAAMSRLGITPSEFQAVYRANCSRARLNIVTTAGPNGQATWTAHLDAEAIIQAATLFKAMWGFAKASGVEWIISSMIGTVSPPETMLPMKSPSAPIVGKIHAIEEWGGKTRLVAILDYWTQALLTPLHDTVAYFIRRLEQDGTFDQGKIIRQVRAWTEDPNIPCNSYDLTAATDRIPVDLQVSLLTYLFGSNTIPALWKTIITDRDFQAPDGTMVRYAVGQPMGVKSSFPMLGLIHHALIQIAAIEAKVERYSKYVVLGDDNSHSNAAVAQKYVSIMGLIGVPINMSKSVLYSVSLKNSAEICKRVFIEGLELTGLPVKAIVKAAKYGHLAATLQDLIHDRGSILEGRPLGQFFAGLLDRRSLQGILMLNKVPLSISGLKAQMGVDIPELDYAKWFDNITVTDEALEHAFTYALVTEQLKRVDGLLRGTMIMADTIAMMTNPDPSKVWPTELFEHLSDADRTAAIAKLPELTLTHPIVLASQNELDRVLSHLSALRSGSKEMVDRARNGLLDLLRNNLSEIWVGEPEAANTVRRSIFNAMLAALKRMNTMKPEADKPRAIDFSLLLSHVQRMWSVHWEWMKPPVINAVKTRITISSTDTTNKLNSSFRMTKIQDLRL